MRVRSSSTPLPLVPPSIRRRRHLCYKGLRATFGHEPENHGLFGTGVCHQDTALHDLLAQVHQLRQQNAALEAGAQQATAPAPTAVIPGARMTVRLTEPCRYNGKSAEDPEEYLNSVEQYFLLGGVVVCFTVV